jgi:predicted nucleic acid-binding protein
VTRAELLYQLKSHSPCHRLHLEVRYFLGIMRALAWDEDAADFYAEILHQMVRGGSPSASSRG